MFLDAKSMPDQISQLTLDDDGAADSDDNDDGVTQPKELPEYACRYYS